MGDVSSEPTMEEILSSIKRVIEESETASPTPRPRRIARSAPPAPEPEDDGLEEILELNERLPAIDPPSEARRTAAQEPAAAARTEPQPKAQPSSEAAPEPSAVPPRSDTILSPGAAEASRGQLEALSRLIVKPDTGGENTLEGLVREMLRPMLREWLDAQLPGIVEAMVAKEIARIAGRSL